MPFDQALRKKYLFVKRANVAALVAASFGLTGPALAASIDSNLSWYAGFGGVASNLAPTGTADGYYVSDKRGGGGRFFLGKGFGGHSRLQLNYVYAGESALSNSNSTIGSQYPDAAIRYQVPSLSYDYLSGYSDDRWRTFARLGVASIRSESVNSTAVIRSSNSVQGLLGAGVEWRMSNIMQLRGVFEYVSQDVQQASLSMAMQFGNSRLKSSRYNGPSRTFPMPIASTSMVVASADPAETSASPVAVSEIQEEQSNTALCSLASHEFSLYYRAGDIDARPAGIAELVTSLEGLPTEYPVQIEIDTHTDGRSSQQKNMMISRMRAERLQTEIQNTYPGADWSVNANWHGESESGGYLMPAEIRNKERRADIHIFCK